MSRILLKEAGERKDSTGMNILSATVLLGPNGDGPAGNRLVLKQELVYFRDSIWRSG